MAARVRCDRCGAEQEAATDRATLCEACGEEVRVPAPDPSESSSDDATPLLALPRSRGDDVFDLGEGDFREHAASLPSAAPPSRFEDIEELTAADKRRDFVLALVPFWGLWRISRSPHHSAGEKLLLFVLSLASTVLVAFVLTTFRPDRTIRISQFRERVDREVRALATIVGEFREERGRLPNDTEWQEAAKQADPRFYDPWGRPYRYESDPTGFRLGTYGADGERGGSGENDDVFADFGGDAKAP